MSKFTATELSSQHLSVGAILFDDQKQTVLMRGSDGIRSMMTETVEDDESLEAALHRGLDEELQARGHIVGFAGCTQSTVHDHRGAWQKTVVWFYVRLLHMPVMARATVDFELHPLTVALVDQSRWPSENMLRLIPGGAR